MENNRGTPRPQPSAVYWDGLWCKLNGAPIQSTATTYSGQSDPSRGGIFSPKSTGPASGPKLKYGRLVVQFFQGCFIAKWKLVGWWVTG